MGVQMAVVTGGPRIGDDERLLCVPAAKVACQRGKQVRPLRPSVAARADRAAPAGHHQPRGGAPAIAAPGHGHGWRGATLAIQPVAGQPQRPRRIVTLLAGRAHQPADGVRAPARHQCPGPVVHLSQRCRVREPRGAARHVTPGSRYPDQITDDTVFSNRNRMNQRIMTPRRTWRPSARRRTHPSQCHHPACPAPQPLRQGMPGHRPCAHPPHPPRTSCTQHASNTSPGSGSRTGIPGAAPGLIPSCKTPDRHPPLPRQPGHELTARPVPRLAPSGPQDEQVEGVDDRALLGGGRCAEPGQACLVGAVGDEHEGGV
jgi:hypothetical protein